MKYGFVLPRGDAKIAAEFAAEAEQAGWDGFFVWEPVWGVDAWVALTAAAMRTERIHLGTMITPIARMRPWKLASETATLDHLSGGRVILSVGLGAIDVGYAEFGEVIDRKTRAELTDEGLEILTGLWRGQPFSFTGKHYQVRPFDRIVAPPPVQQPRIPIWVVGAYPSVKSMARAIRYDGLLPNLLGPDGHPEMRPPTMDEVREMRRYIQQHRTHPGPYEIVIEGNTPGDARDENALLMRQWEDAGATWWIEADWTSESLDPVLRRIRQGPPGR